MADLAHAMAQLQWLLWQSAQQRPPAPVWQAPPSQLVVGPWPAAHGPWTWPLQGAPPPALEGPAHEAAMGAAGAGAAATAKAAAAEAAVAAVAARAAAAEAAAAEAAAATKAAAAKAAAAAAGAAAAEAALLEKVRGTPHRYSRPVPQRDSCIL